MSIDPNHLSKAFIHLDHLTHNMRLLQELVGKRPMWPAIKANAYGHGLEIIARHLVRLGYHTLCVAHVNEAIALVEAGVDANIVLLSAALPEHSEAIVRYGCEPTICTLEMAEALAAESKSAGKQVTAHLKVETGMGRIGIAPEDVVPFLEQCLQYPTLKIRGLMSHFACADEADKTLSLQQIERFKSVIKQSRAFGVEVHHMANSAAVFDLPGAHFDAVRPGISIYGLPPSHEMINPRVSELKPVLEWKSRITCLKEVPAGVGLSYGHTYHTEQPSLIATIPAGYGDGLRRNLSNNFDMLVHGRRC
ncbi:MAG: alanine racemase, partial [Granulosicoccaceae bacterium]